MNQPDSDVCKNLVIVNELGLHARSAAMIAEVAKNALSGVWIHKGEEKADASSVIDILTLECSKGTKISLTTENRSDIDILNAIAELIEKGFGE
jgi:phosphotransferase system HPr (HPr) family protein